MNKNYITLGTSGSAALNDKRNSNVSTMFSSLAAWQKKAFLALLFVLFSIFGASAQVSVAGTTAGTTPVNYSTLNAAFTAINAGTHKGAITVLITGNTTEPATAVPLLASGGSSSYTAISIKPSGGSFTINSAATPTASKGVIILSGADNVTIDGDDTATAGTQNLSIVVASTTNSGTAAIQLASNSTSGADGADNNTIKNCIITGGRSSATTTTVSYGIVMCNISLITTGAYSSVNTKIQNNTITRAYHGIYANGASATYPNTGTQILNNTLGSATSANNIGSRGIYLTYSAVSSGGAVISGNDIRVGDYGTTGYSATIAGIEIGTVNFGFTINGNNIHDLNQPTIGGYGAHGIYITGSANNTTSTISNNFIRDVKVYVYQASATSTFIPTGVFFTAGATGVNFVNNTIVMNAQLFSSSTFSSFCVDASVSTVSFAKFQNNILVNNVTSTAAYGFYTAATANISAGTVNNNNYYVPGGNVGYYNAANATTFAAWKTATGKDENGINVNPPFISATNLHINPLGTGAVSFSAAGASGTGITTDFDGDTRDTNRPDIGADEFVYVPSCASTPSPADAATEVAQTASFSWAAVAGAKSYDVYLNGTLVSTAQTALTYTPSFIAASTTHTWKVVPKNATSCSTWSFTTQAPVATVLAGTLTAFSNTCVNQTSVAGSFTLSGVNLTSDITLAALNGYTYSTASNGTYTSTLTISPSSGSISTIVYVKFTPTSATSYSGNIVISGGGLSSSVNVAASGTGIAPLAGEYTVGASGVYTTLAAAVAAYNSIPCLTDNVVFKLIDATYDLGTTPVAINANSGAGSYTLTIKPSSTATITGAVATGALIKLNGADNVIIDGSNSGGTDRSLTITNTSASTSAGIWIGSASASNGATNNTVKNCIISGATATPATIGVVVGSAITIGGAAESPNNNTTIQNNLITTAQNGIFFTGNATSLDTGLVISGNTLGSSVTANKLSFRGVLVNSANAFAINNNTILGVSSSTASTSTIVGIQLGGALLGAGNIYNNKISDVKSNNTSGYYAYGILLAPTATNATINIYNNQISDVASWYYEAGIDIASGSNYNVYHNTISLATTLSTTYSAFGIYLPGGSGLNIRNNIISNTTNNASKYAIYSTVAKSAFTAISNNNYYVSGTLSGTVGLGYIASTSYYTLANMATAFGDANSIIADPILVANAGFIPSTGSPVVNAGTPISTYTTDINGATRSSTTPTLGAYETTYTRASANFTLLSPVDCRQSVAHNFKIDGTAGQSALASATATYTINGGASNNITLTQSGSTWTGTIPSVTPANATVAYSYFVTDANGVSSVAGTGNYTDFGLDGVTVTAVASPAIGCAGSPVKLTCNALAPGKASVGAGGTTSSTTAATFFPGSWGGAKTQYIVKAAELTAAGISPGNITSLAFEVVSVGQTYQGFTVQVGHTTAQAMTTTFLSTSMTQVFKGTLTNDGYLPTVGVNTLSFGTGVGSSTSFLWNGTDNIVVSICWSSVPSASTSTATSMKVDATSPSFVCSAYDQTDSVTPASECATSVGDGTGSSRPKFTFGGIVNSTMASYSWKNDATSTVVGTTNPLNVTPTTAATYTVTTATAGGCTTTATTNTITIQALPSAPTVTNGARCGTGLVTSATVASTSGETAPIFKWYDAATGGNLKQSSTATSYTTSITATTDLWVVELKGTCESTRTKITLTVNAPPVIEVAVTTGNQKNCGAGPFTLVLSATSADTGMTYAWSTASSTAVINSGANAADVNVTITESTDFMVTGTPTDASCAPVVFYYPVVVYSLPIATTTTTASGVCPGTSATINSGLSAENFSASCINAPGALSTPPASAVTLISGSVVNPLFLQTTVSQDDGGWADVPIGFTFNYFGSPFTAINVSTNGTLNFGPFASFNSAQYTFTDGFPSSTSPANTIAACARDLYFTTGSEASIKYWTEGYTPSRKFIVQYANVPTYETKFLTGTALGTNNVEVVFYETLGTVEMRVIGATSGGGTSTTSIKKYIGLQNGLQTIGATAPRCTAANTQNFWNGVSNEINNPQAWRFDPADNYTTTWWATPSGGNRGQIASGTNIFTQSVSPSVTTLYEIFYTNQTTNCTNAAGSAQVSMEVLGATAPTGVVAVSDFNPICGSAPINLSLDFSNAVGYRGNLDGLTFQWQSSTDGGATWPNIDFATTATYNVTPSQPTRYRCVIKSCGGTAVNTAPVNVTFTNTLTGVTQPDAACGTVPTNIVLSGLIPNTTFIVSYNINGGTTKTVSVTSDALGTGTFSTSVGSGSGTKVLTITNLDAGTCSQNITANNTVTLTVSSSSVTTSPTVSNASISVIPNSTAVLSATPTDPSYTLRWYNAAVGGTLLASTNSYTTPALCTPSATLSYYVEERNETCPGARALVVVNVQALIVSDPSNGLICSEGGSVQLTANVANTSNFTWSGSPLSSTTASVVTANPTATTQYGLSVGTSGVCGTITSTFNVGVIQGASFTPTASLTTACANQAVQLNANLSSSNFSVGSIPFVDVTVPSTGVTYLVTNGSTTAPAGAALTGGTLDDGGWNGIPIGFTYNFFGADYTSLAVGTNGVLGLGNWTDFTTTGLGKYAYSVVNGNVFPLAANPKNVIALMASDLIHSLSGTTGGTIRYWNEGIAPTRKFVIQFLGVRQYNNTNTYTFHCVLNETTGSVEIYVKNAPAGTGNNAPTIGLQNFDATIGATAPNRTKFTTAITTSEAWTFSPAANYSFEWKSSSNLSDAFIVNPVFAAGSAAGTYSYTVDATNPNTGCVTTKSAPSFTVVSLPAAPAATTAYSYCQNGTAAALTAAATGTNTLMWYTVATGGTGTAIAPTPSTATVGTVSYWVAQKSAEGCTGDRTEIVITVKALPATPNVSTTSPVNYCKDAVAVALTVTSSTVGNALNWYYASSGGTANTAITPSTATAGSTNYYVSSEDAAGCESTRATITVNVNTPPAAPGVVGSNVTYCQNEVAAALNATTAGSGYVLNWYTSATGGSSTSSITPSTTAVGTTTYYVSQSNTNFATNCEGPRAMVTVTVNSLPTVFISAPSTTTCDNSDPITFTATPSNAGTPSNYEWHVNNGTDTIVQSSSSNQFVYSTPTTGDIVSVIMTSATSCSNNAISSNPITLSGDPVTPSITINAVPPTNICPGGSVTFTSSIANGGASPAYDWYVDGIAQAVNSATFTYSSATGASVYATLHSSLGTSCISGSADVSSNAVGITYKTATSIVSTPSSLLQCAGSTAQFSVSALGTNLTYQWLLNGSPITGNATATSSTLIVNSITSSNAGSYTVMVSGDCGVVTSTPAATLSLYDATTIVTQPVGQTVCANSNYTFSAVATGGAGTYTYVWKKNGAVLNGQSAASLVLNNITSANAGTYTVTVTGNCNNVVSAPAVLAVNAATSIVTSPLGSTQCPGSTINLSVSAAGSGTLSYKWKFGSTSTNGTYISGATASAYSISGVTAANQGYYSVEVTSSTNCGTVVSTPVLITINQATAIINQPAPITVCEAGIANFSVSATGTNLTYQWKKGTSVLAGATSSSYSRNPVQVNDGGSYSVVVTGSCGILSSNAAALTVNAKPVVDNNTVRSCTGTAFVGTPPSAPANTTYTWTTPTYSSPSVTGGSGQNVGIATISQTLTNTSTATQTATYTVTPIAATCAGTPFTLTVTVDAIPSLSSTTTPTAICSGATFSYTATSATTTATFGWTRAVVSGISNLAGSGSTAVISEVLTNTTTAPINVEYVFTLTNGGCTKVTTVTVRVNPTPVLSSALTAATCSNTALSYTASSATSGTTYSWSRSAVTGISNSGNSNTTNPLTENLINTTAAAVAVNYEYTLTANGCASSVQNVVVTVNPLPALSNATTTATICSGTGFSYSATTATGGTTFSWSRAAVTGISNTASTGAVALINETLINTTKLPINVIYAYTLSTTSCSKPGQNVTVTVNPTPSIAAKTATICQSGSFTVTPVHGTDAVPDGTTYSWSAPVISGTAANVTGGTAGTGAANISGTLTNTTTSSQTATYTVTPTSGAAGSCAGASFTITVTLSPTSVGGNVAGGTTVCTGTNSTTLTLSGHTGAITRWEKSLDNFATAGTSITNTTTSLIASNLTATTYYRAVITSGPCTSANSAVATVTVSPTSVGGTVAGSAIVCTGTNSTTLTLSGHTGAITRWESSASSTFASGVTSIANTTDTLTATDLTATTYYRAVLTSSPCSSANSAKATVTVSPASVGGTVAGSTTVCTGTNSSTLTLSGHTGAITRWESSLDNFATAGTSIANTTTTLTAINLTATTYYRAILTSSPCSAANSAVAIVTVSPTSVGGTVAGSATVCTGTNSTALTLSGHTGAITRWESSASSTFASGVTSIANTSDTFTATNLTATTYYRAVVTSSPCSAANSAIATVTVTPASVGGTVAGSTTVCTGTNTTTLTVSGYTGTITNWESSVDNFATTGTSIANTTDTLVATGLTETTYYRAVVTNSPCGSANSATAIVTVSPVSVGGTVAGSATVCAVVNSTTLTLSGHTGAVTRWESSTSSTFDSGVASIASTTDALMATNLTTTTYYRAVVTSGACAATNSDTATVTVNPTPVIPAQTAAICNGDMFTVTPTDGGATIVPSGTTYTWTVLDNTNVSGDVAETTPQASISQTLSNSTNAVQQVVYTVTPTSGAAGSCVGATFTVTVTVNPTSEGGTVSSDQVICTGFAPANLTLAGNIGAVTKWQKSATADFASPTDIVSTSTTLTGAVIGTLAETTYFRSVVQSGSGNCSTAYSSNYVTITVTPASVGGTVDGSATVCTGTNSTALTLSGYTGAITRWESSASSTFASGVTSIANTTDTLTATNLTATTYYRAVLTSSPCSSANSAIAAVTVTPASVGGTVSGSTTVCTGTNSATLTLSGYTGVVTGWESSTSSTFASAVTSVGSNSTSLTVTDLTETTYYRAIITNSPCGSANSAIATVTVSPLSVGGTIDGSAAVCALINSTTLTLSGHTGAITRWESSTSSSFTSGVNSIANTTDTLTATNLTATTYYRAVITSSPCSSANSAVATVTVNPTPVIADQTAIICNGDAFTVSPINGAPSAATIVPSGTTYTWTVVDNTNVSGDVAESTPQVSITQTLTNSTNTVQEVVYTVTPTSGAAGSCVGATFTVTVTVNPTSVGGTVSNNQVICTGSSPADVTLAGNIGAVTKWQKSTTTDFASTTDITSTSTTLTGAVIGTLTETTYFRAVVQSGNGVGACASANSNYVQVTVIPASVGGTVAGSATVCSGSNITSLTLSGYTGAITAWESSTSSTFTSAVTNIENTSATLTATGLTETTYFRAIVTSSPCSSVYSSTATVIVNPILTASVSIAITSGAQTSCVGTSVTFTATPTNGGVAPSYQWKVNGNDAGTDSATFTSSTLASGDAVTVVMTSNASPCLANATATSNAINVTVNPTITASVSIASSCGASSATFTATPVNGGSDPAYQWKINGNNVIGANSATFTTSALANNDQVTVVMASSASPCLTNPSVTSNTITVTLNPELAPSVSIVITAGTQASCVGTSVTFTATPTNGGEPSYQWKVNGTNAGTNSATFTSSTLADNDVVKVEMTSTAASCWLDPTVTSNTITVDVNPLNTITLTSASTSNNQSLCNPANFASITYATTAATGATFSGLPAGVTGSWSSDTVTISGTPTVNGTFNYTVTLTGGCGTVTATGTIGTYITTWTVSSGVGSWSNGAPTASVGAVISGNYAENVDLTACTLTVNNNAVVLVVAGKDFHIAGAVTVETGSSLTVEHNANLLQDGTANVNSGEITAKRVNSSMRRLDYTYWSSPTAKSDYSLKMFSPMTISPISLPAGGVTGASRFYYINETTNTFVAVEPTQTFFDDANIARGWTIRAPNNFPTNGDTATFNANWIGKPNSGNITIPVTYSGAGKGSNLIGNPYPSTIDTDAFLTYSPDNGATLPNAGTIYFWTHSVQNAQGTANYASCNLSGKTAASAGGPAPNGKIQVGQGFILKKAAASTVVFNNSMRAGNNEGQFFKTATIEKNRIWLNLAVDTTPLNQIMVGYIEGTTLGFDDSYDGKLINNASSISSIIDNENYVIQARPTPFVNTDEVPLSFNATTAGSYTLSLDHVDGLFLGEQNVYLKDNLLNVTHDIKAGAYTFTSDQGTFSDRFEVVYINSTLNISTPTFDANSVIVYKDDNKVLNINAGKVVMKNVKIYDVRGRFVYEKSNINSTTTALKDLKAEQEVLLVKITSDDNKVVTKKVVF